MVKTIKQVRISVQFIVPQACESQGGRSVWDICDGWEPQKSLTRSSWVVGESSKTYKNVLCFLSFMVCSNGTKYEPIHMAASSLDSP